MQLWPFVKFVTVKEMLFEGNYLTYLANVSATMSGKIRLASQETLTDFDPALIFPHETASSGLAPASLPSNSWPVFMYTE